MQTKNYLRKTLALVMAFLMIVTMLPMNVFAQSPRESAENTDPTLDIINPTLSTNLKTYYDVRGMQRSNLRYANINYESTEVKNGIETITMNLSKWTDSGVGFGHNRNDKYSGQIILNFFDKNFYENIEKIELSRGGSTRQLTKDLKYKNESEVIPNGAQWMIKITDAPVSYALLGVVTNSALKITMKSGKTLKDLGLEGKDIAINHVWVLDNGKIAAESVSNTVINTNKETTNGEFKNDFLVGKPGMKIIYRPKEGVLQTVHSFKSNQNFLQTDYNWLVYLKELVPKELVPFLENYAWIKRTDEVGNEDRFTDGKFNVGLYTDDQGRYIFDTSKTSNISIRTTGNANAKNLDEARKNLDKTVFYGVLGQSRNYTIEYTLKKDKTSKEFVETIVKYVQEHNQQVEFISWMEADKLAWAEKGNAEPPRKLDHSEHVGFIESIDSDGDGLFDMLEWLYETDYRNPDTDGDGVPDGQEVLIDKTDPLKADSYKPGKPKTTTDTISRDEAVTIKGNAPRNKFARPFVTPIEALPVTADNAGGVIVRAVPYSVDQDGKPVINEKVVYAGTTISKENLDAGNFTLNIRENTIPQDVSQIALVTYSPDKKNPVIGSIISVGQIIKFHPNGGKFGESEDSQDVLIKQGKVVLPGKEPTRENYTFKGWATKPNVDAKDFAKLGSITSAEDWTSPEAKKVDETSIAKPGSTAYAVWEKNEYRVRFHRNLGNPDDYVELVAKPNLDPNAQDENKGAWELPRVNAVDSELKGFEKSKYTFVGWTKDPNGKNPDELGTVDSRNPRTGAVLKKAVYQNDGSNFQFDISKDPYTVDLYACYTPYITVTAEKTWHVDATSGATKYAAPLGAGLIYRTAVGEHEDPVINAQLASYSYLRDSYQESPKVDFENQRLIGGQMQPATAFGGKITADYANRTVKYEWTVPGYDKNGDRLSYLFAEINPKDKDKLKNWSGAWEDINIKIKDNSSTSVDGGKTQIVYANSKAGSKEKLDAYSGATVRTLTNFTIDEGADKGVKSFDYHIAVKNVRLKNEPPSLSPIYSGETEFEIGLPKDNNADTVVVEVNVSGKNGQEKMKIELTKNRNGNWTSTGITAVTIEDIPGSLRKKIVLPEGMTFVKGDTVKAKAKSNDVYSDEVEVTVTDAPAASAPEAPKQFKKDADGNVILKTQRPELGIGATNKYYLTDKDGNNIKSNGQDIVGEILADKTIVFKVPDGILKDKQQVKVRAAENRKTDSFSELSAPLDLQGPAITAENIELIKGQLLKDHPVTTDENAVISIDKDAALPDGFSLRYENDTKATIFGLTDQIIETKDVKIIAEDELGNKSEKTITITVKDLPKSEAPTIVQIPKTGDEPARIKVTGKPNAMIDFKDANGKVVRSITLDDTGIADLIVNPENIIDGNVILAQKEENHNPSDDVKLALDTKGPSAPYITPVKEGSDKITVVPTDRDTEKVTLTLPDGKVLAKEKKDFTNGTAVFEIPKGVQAGTVKGYVVVAYDEFNNPSDEAKATIISKSADAQDLKASNKGENPTTTTVEGKATPGAVITIKNSMGKPIKTENPVIADDQGKFTAEIPLQDKGAVIFVTTKEEGKDPSNDVPTKVFIDKNSDGIDDDKQASKPAEDVKALNQNKTEPNEDPTKNDPKDTTTVTGKAVPGSKITIKDENDKDITPQDGVTVKKDGTFTAEVKKQDPGKKVNVIVTEPAGEDGIEKKPSTPVEATVGTDTNNDGKAEETETTDTPTVKARNIGPKSTKTTVEGKAPKGSTVTIKYTPEGGQETTKTVTAGEDGTYKLDIEPKLPVDKEVTVTAKDGAKKESLPAKTQVFDDKDNDGKDDRSQHFDIEKADSIKMIYDPAKMNYLVTSKEGTVALETKGMVVEVTDKAGIKKRFKAEEIVADTEHFTVAPAEGAGLTIEANNGKPIKVTLNVQGASVTEATTSNLSVKLDKDGNGVADDQEQFDIKKATKVEIIKNPDKMNYLVNKTDGKVKFETKGLVVKLTDDSGKSATYTAEDLANKEGVTIKPANDEEIGLTAEGKTNRIPLEITVNGKTNEVKPNVVVQLDADGNGIADEDEESAMPENVKAMNQNIEENGEVTDKEKTTTTVTGKVKPGATVKITSEDGQTDLTPSQVDIDSEGNFTAEITKQNVGTKIKVWATEPGKKISKPAPADVFRDANNDGIDDSEFSGKPSIVTPVKNGDTTVEVNGQESAKAYVVITDKNGNETKTPETTLTKDQDGKIKITVPELKDGQTIKVVQKDGDKKPVESDPVVVKPDTTGDKLENNIAKAEEKAGDQNKNLDPKSSTDKELQDALEKAQEAKEKANKVDQNGKQTPENSQKDVDDANDRLKKALEEKDKYDKAKEAVKEATKEWNKIKDKTDPAPTDEEYKAVKDKIDAAQKAIDDLNDKNGTADNTDKPALQKELDKIHLDKVIKQGEEKLKDPNLDPDEKKKLQDAVDEGKKTQTDLNDGNANNDPDHNKINNDIKAIEDALNPKAKTAKPDINDLKVGDTIIKGTAPAGSTVTVTVGTNEPITVKADDGSWSITTAPLVDKTKVTAIAQEVGKTESDQAEKIAGVNTSGLDKAIQAGKDALDPKKGGSDNNTPEDKALKDAINKGEEVKNNPGSSQDDIDTAQKAIEKAIIEKKKQRIGANQIKFNNYNNTIEVVTTAENANVEIYLSEYDWEEDNVKLILIGKGTDVTKLVSIKLNEGVKLNTGDKVVIKVSHKDYLPLTFEVTVE